MRSVKQRYGDRYFALPEEQIKWFSELTPSQVEEVKKYFTADLVDVDKYIYAIKRDGHLVCNRQFRNPLLEM